MRTVSDWVGKTDDAMPTAAAKARIIERQSGQCALTGITFRPGDKIEFDHMVPLWLGGKNAESNLQAVLSTAHAGKTRAEATVRAKVNRMRAKHLGTYPKSKAKLRSRGFPKSRNEVAQ